MLGQFDVEPLGGFQDRAPAPRRDFSRAFFAPVANRLQGEPGGTRYGARAITECGENVMNSIHNEDISDIRIQKSSGHYPIFAHEIPCENPHKAAMAGFVFDIDRVRSEMSRQRVKQEDLRRAVGLTSQSAISNILNGKRQVKVDEATAIYKALDIPMVEGERPAAVPIIGLANAGSWREAIQMPVGWMSVPPRVAGPKAFGIEVVGDSMNLLIEDGGYIVVDPARKELEAGKCYLIQNREYEVTVKVYCRNPARFEPMSDNPDHGTIMADDVDAILGRVVWKGAPV